MERDQRPKRKRVSRVITINGYTVFKANNYDLGEGELSVWETELNSPSEETETGDKENKITTTLRSRTSKSLPPNFKLTPKPPKSASKQKTLNIHNQTIKAARDASFARKQEFLRLNWRSLNPFLDSSLKCPKISSTHEKMNFPILKSQPDCLKNVVMRDYQLAGVNWVSKDIYLLLCLWLFLIHFLKYFS
jgi:hypothetical protein